MLLPPNRRRFVMWDNAEDGFLEAQYEDRTALPQEDDPDFWDWDGREDAEWEDYWAEIDRERGIRNEA